MTTFLQAPVRSAARPHRGIAWIAFTGSALLALFWGLYFSGLLEFGQTETVLAEYEAAFPIADAVLAAILFTAGIGLWNGRRFGRFCLNSGASMTLYLGILDVTFYTRQGTYSSLGSGGVVELVINFLCIVGALVALATSWKLEKESS